MFFQPVVVCRKEPSLGMGLQGCFFDVQSVPAEVICLFQHHKRPEASMLGLTQPIRLAYSSEKLVKKAPLKSACRLE